MFEEELKKCETMKQVFMVCEKYYNINEPLGIIGGALVKSKIPGIIKALNLKKHASV
jgi:hypothetical protein